MSYLIHISHRINWETSDKFILISFCNLMYMCRTPFDSFRILRSYFLQVVPLIFLQLPNTWGVWSWLRNFHRIPYCEIEFAHYEIVNCNCTAFNISIYTNFCYHYRARNDHYRISFKSSEISARLRNQVKPKQARGLRRRRKKRSHRYRPW